jgi:hypothetical protein
MIEVTYYRCRLCRHRLKYKSSLQKHYEYDKTLLKKLYNIDFPPDFTLEDMFEKITVLEPIEKISTSMIVKDVIEGKNDIKLQELKKRYGEL